MPSISEREELIRLVSDKIHRGTLFPLSSKRCWAGPATGQVCVVCGKAVHEGHEFEIEGPQGVVTAHVACESVWREVSTSLNAKSDPASAS
jgi:hypothetical protein